MTRCSSLCRQPKLRRQLIPHRDTCRSRVRSVQSCTTADSHCRWLRGHRRCKLLLPYRAQHIPDCKYMRPEPSRHDSIAIRTASPSGCLSSVQSRCHSARYNRSQGSSCPLLIRAASRLSCSSTEHLSRFHQISSSTHRMYYPPGSDNKDALFYRLADDSRSRFASHKTRR